jgi:hypothetical protein
MRHIEVIPVTNNGRIRVVARENAGLEGGGFLCAAAKGGGQSQGQEAGAKFHVITVFVW